MTSQGILYIVSTPIGNMDDVTLRALKVLRKVDHVVCEDTRHTRKLLTHYDIHKRISSFFIGNEKTKSQNVLSHIKKGLSVALVTDSGTPSVSDPGYSLVEAALGAGIRVEAIPGPSAFLAALVSSGAPMDEFTFIGFLPPKGAKRIKHLKEVVGLNRTVVLYESCHRIKKLLGELFEILPDTSIMVCRELTKRFEEVRRATVQEHIQYFEIQEPLGEFVIVIPKPLKRKSV